MNSESIPFRIEGKIVVDHDIEKITRLNNRAKELNMDGVRPLERNEILDLEPNCKFESALYVPQAGVVDYKVVTETIAKKFETLGGTVKYFQKIKSIDSKNDLKILTSDKETFTSEYLINCAGLFSDTVAMMDDIKPNLRIIPFRGEYFVLNQEKSHLVKNMIYPISDPNLPFLGIHLTKTVDGQIEAGPNAVLAFAKEGYKWSNINVFEFSKTILYKGMWKLGRKYFGTGISEMLSLIHI